MVVWEMGNVIFGGADWKFLYLKVRDLDSFYLSNAHCLTLGIADGNIQKMETVNRIKKRTSKSFNKITICIYCAALMIFSGCRPQNVELGEQCLRELNLSYFKGVSPDIYVDELYRILGQPDEKLEVKGDESGIDLAYYHEQGRILLHWSGHEGDEIGMIEFRPKTKIKLSDILRRNVVVKKERVQFKCNGEHKVTIELEKDLVNIKEIHWWFR
jgi:hypothetical protein